jgi:hypothetical protein
MSSVRRIEEEAVEWTASVEEPNPLVRRLWGGDADPLHVNMLRGFLGPVVGNDVVLFTDIELRQGVLVPIASIRLHLRFPHGDSSPLEIDALWIDRGTATPAWARAVERVFDEGGGNQPGGADSYRPRRW